MSAEPTAAVLVAGACCVVLVPAEREAQVLWDAIYLGRSRRETLGRLPGVGEL